MHLCMSCMHLCMSSESYLLCLIILCLLFVWIRLFIYYSVYIFSSCWLKFLLGHLSFFSPSHIIYFPSLLLSHPFPHLAYPTFLMNFNIFPLSDFPFFITPLSLRLIPLFQLHLPSNITIHLFSCVIHFLNFLSVSTYLFCFIFFINPQFIILLLISFTIFFYFIHHTKVHTEIIPVRHLMLFYSVLLI